MRRDWGLHSLHSNDFENPNGQDVKNLISNHISQFHHNLTVNESEIIVLRRQFWVSAGKEKTTTQRIFLSAPTFFRNYQWWECLKISSKPSSQISWWSNGEWVWDHRFSEIGLVVCGKKRKFWEEQMRKRNWEKEETYRVSSVWKLT